MWSVNKCNVRDVLVPKPCSKSARTASSRPLIALLKKLYIRSRQVDRNIVLIYVGRPTLEHTTKTNCITFQRYALFWYFINVSGTSLSTTFSVLLFKKIFLMICSICLVLEILGNLFPSLWRHKFWN